MNLKKIYNFFQRNINYLIVFSFLIFVFSISFGRSSLETLRLLKIRRDLTEQISQSSEENKQLDEEIALIGTQEYIEKIARQYLELYYPNEQIVIPVENSMQEEAANNQGKSEATDTVPDGESTEDTTQEDNAVEEEVIPEEETASPEENIEADVEGTEVEITEETDAEQTEQG